MAEEAENNGVAIDKSKVVEEVTSIRQKNLQALAKLRELFDKAELEKTLRDRENAAVKNSASNIEALRSQLTELKPQMQKLEDELKPLAEQLCAPDKIKREIAALEYSLHVSYSPAREKAVSQKVKQLNKQLKLIGATSPKIKELSQLRATFRDLRKRLATAIAELKTHASQSEVHHKNMIGLLGQADELQSTLPKAFGELDEKRTLLISLTEVERAERAKHRLEAAKQREQSKAAVAEKLAGVKQRAQEILDKFKTGKPISLEELQVLQVAGIEI